MNDGKHIPASLPLKAVNMFVETRLTPTKWDQPVFVMNTETMDKPDKFEVQKVIKCSIKKK